MRRKILISAGEASGDLYAARLVEALRERHPDAEFFGCTGEQMRAAGVRTVVDAANLAVVGLVEVLRHIPRIYGEFHKLCEAARRERPDFAVLTDSPDFHLRVARKLTKLGIPVVYLVAPQVWAWRKGRIRALRRNVRKLLCIFPFEENFFREHGLPASYIGHPLGKLLKPRLGREEFLKKHRLPLDRPLVVLLPGSRRGEIARHMPVVVGAANRLYQSAAVSLVLAAPAGSSEKFGARFYTDHLGASPITLVEGETWDAIAAADLALAASGTVSTEAAILGTPMVTFYRVAWLTWHLGKHLVDVPFYTMVNLIAGRGVVPELIQHDCTPDRLAAEAERLLAGKAARIGMKMELATVRNALLTADDPMERAARELEPWFTTGEPCRPV